MPSGKKNRGTLGWMFKDAGYNTGYFGKSHWGSNDVRPYGFDNLMIDGIRNGQRLSAVKYNGYWLDIGRPGDYDQANADFEELQTKWRLRD
jgi:arylsulfatase A-like enzyme